MTAKNLASQSLFCVVLQIFIFHYNDTVLLILVPYKIVVSIKHHYLWGLRLNLTTDWLHNVFSPNMTFIHIKTVKEASSQSMGTPTVHATWLYKIREGHMRLLNLIDFNQFFYNLQKGSAALHLWSFAFVLSLYILKAWGCHMAKVYHGNHSEGALCFNNWTVGYKSTADGSKGWMKGYLQTLHDVWILEPS